MMREGPRKHQTIGESFRNLPLTESRLSRCNGGLSQGRCALPRPSQGGSEMSGWSHFAPWREGTPHPAERAGRRTGHMRSCPGRSPHARLHGAGEKEPPGPVSSSQTPRVGFCSLREALGWPWVKRGILPGQGETNLGSGDISRVMDPLQSKHSPSPPALTLPVKIIVIVIITLYTF